MPLATLLAGPFLALFANIVYFEKAMQVLDHLILQKEDCLISIIKSVYSNSVKIILRHTNSAMLKAFLSR